MLDYEEVKRVYAEKLAADRTGRGRMEAAFYAAIRFAYEAGLADGTEQCQLQVSRVEELQNICRIET